MIISTVVATIGRYVGIAALGAGAVFGVQCYRDKSARDAIKDKIEIKDNAIAIDTATATQVLTSTAHRSAVGGFRSFAGETRSNPASSPLTLACIDRAEAVISTCAAQHAADTTLIALYRKRADLMEDEAVRARRGKLLAMYGAFGYQPIGSKGPAGRVGADLNFSDRWSVMGTFDETAEIEKDSTGKRKTTFRPSAFVGLKYSFGGRR